MKITAQETLVEIFDVDKDFNLQLNEVLNQFDLGEIV